MRINEVEQQVGITKKNIRFYEEQGLIHPGRQIENGYRNYTLEDVDVLRKIKLLRKLAVPIEEIRGLQMKHLTLEDCLRRHEITLNREEENLKQIRLMCEELIAGRVDFSTLDSEGILLQMEEKERGGTRFMNIHARDRKMKKKIAPFIITAVIIIYMAFLLGMFIWASQAESMPIAMLIIVLLAPAAVIVGVILALRERLKEIEGGEEDAASKY